MSYTQWPRIQGTNIPLFTRLNYYPIGETVTKDEVNTRLLIWSFKNEAGKQYIVNTEEARNAVVNEMSSVIMREFSGTQLSELTLFCIPASTRNNHTRRFGQFSRELCNQTGLNNAFDHYSIQIERMASHNGGRAGTPNDICFEEEYFNGKRIVLFDDLTTSGNSFRVFAEKLQQLGATVIAAIALGQTCHK